MFSSLFFGGVMGRVYTPPRRRGSLYNMQNAMIDFGDLTIINHYHWLHRRSILHKLTHEKCLMVNNIIVNI